ncbi:MULTISPECIES: hypothetical protein [Pseudomonas syringae group]|uniref:hypothetical protein n=1 Tax=Pseudomonas syringae group TaxID=136849 RepID=UPI000F00C0D5|nr:MULTISPECIES: hypothetical protein [Pseudomonas syringae group]MBI6848609.1 hypothetical protein [Pseudomonas syringae]TES52378.1 hypothetical protein E2N91_30045 [Pseudomonas syringae pv. tomato]
MSLATVNTPAGPELKFIQSYVTVSLSAEASIHVPPVVGRSFANAIVDLLRADFPSARLAVDDVFHYSFDGLGAALLASDLVSRSMVASAWGARRGFQFLARLGLDAGGGQ